MSDVGPVERAVVTKRRIYRLAPEQEGVPVEGGIFLSRGAATLRKTQDWANPCKLVRSPV